MAHYHFIVNPAAAAGSGLNRFQDLLPIIRNRCDDFSVAYTEYSGHGGELARQALQDGREILVAVGGDGTVREVAAELLHTHAVLGILPTGTGNDLIKALKIPSELSKAAELLFTGVPKWTDAAQVNGTPYFNVAGMGFDVEVLEKARKFKRRLRGGILPYLLGLLQAALELRHHPLRIEADDRRFVENALILAVGNGTHLGGGMKITPQANPSDGLLDVCVIHDVRRRTVARLLTRFIRGEHVGQPVTHYFQTSRLRVDCTETLAIQLDGEIIEKTPAVFQILPKALRILLP